MTEPDEPRAVETMGRQRIEEGGDLAIVYWLIVGASGAVITGHGEPVAVVDAMSWAAAMNEQYPNGRHWVVPVKEGR